jgi:hypothetical protein
MSILEQALPLLYPLSRRCGAEHGSTAPAGPWPRSFINSSSNSAVLPQPIQLLSPTRDNLVSDDQGSIAHP